MWINRCVSPLLGTFTGKTWPHGADRDGAAASRLAPPGDHGDRADSGAWQSGGPVCRSRRGTPLLGHVTGKTWPHAVRSEMAAPLTVNAPVRVHRNPEAPYADQ